MTLQSLLCVHNCIYDVLWCDISACNPVAITHCRTLPIQSDRDKIFLEMENGESISL
jgi:hypothetical protein